MKRYLKYIILTLGIFLFIYYAPTIFGGYTYNEKTAVKKSFPNQDGEIVFEQDFEDKRLYILDTGVVKYVKLIDRKWGIFYRASMFSSIRSTDSKEMMERTWSASLKKNQRYDTIFGVEVADSNIG